MSDRLTDDQVALYTLDVDVPRADVKAMADELLRLRKRMRSDSHRAGQIKKARWLVETLLAKLERTEDYIEATEWAADKGATL